MVMLPLRRYGKWSAGWTIHPSFMAEAKGVCIVAKTMLVEKISLGATKRVLASKVEMDSDDVTPLLD